jgi:hypothetical protein
VGKVAFKRTRKSKKVDPEERMEMRRAFHQGNFSTPFNMIRRTTREVSKKPIRSRARI